MMLGNVKVMGRKERRKKGKQRFCIDVERGEGKEGKRKGKKRKERRKKKEKSYARACTMHNAHRSAPV